MSARVIVCGSRGWTNRSLIAETLNDLVQEHGWQFPDPTVVHGGAKGADRLAADEAGKAGLVVEPAHLPDYDRWGKKLAPLKRNEQMASLGADLCVAFWDGRSTGTADMMRRAETHGIPVRIVEVPA